MITDNILPLNFDNSCACLEIKAILSSFDWILKHVAASSPQTLVRQIPRTLSASRKVVLRVGRAPTGPIDTEWIRRWLLTTIDTTTQWIIWHVNNTEKSEFAARSVENNPTFGFMPVNCNTLDYLQEKMVTPEITLNTCWHKLVWIVRTLYSVSQSV